MTSLFLLGLFLFILFYPSGPKCPKCGTYKTTHAKGTGHRMTKGSEVKVCWKCDHIWDRRGNLPGWLRDEEDNKDQGQTG